MYIIVRSQEVPGPKNPIRLGYPEDTAPNIAFLNTGSFSSNMNFNAKILRESLLNSPELLKSLGLKVIDLNVLSQEKPTPTPKKKAPAKKQEPVKAEVVEAPEEPTEDVVEEPTVEEPIKEGDDEWK